MVHHCTIMHNHAKRYCWILREAGVCHLQIPWHDLPGCSLCMYGAILVVPRVLIPINAATVALLLERCGYISSLASRVSGANIGTDHLGSFS